MQTIPPLLPRPPLSRGLFSVRLCVPPRLRRVPATAWGTHLPQDTLNSICQDPTSKQGPTHGAGGHEFGGHSSIQCGRRVRVDPRPGLWATLCPVGSGPLTVSRGRPGGRNSVSRVPTSGTPGMQKPRGGGPALPSQEPRGLRGGDSDVPPGRGPSVETRWQDPERSPRGRSARPLRRRCADGKREKMAALWGAAVT